MFKWFKNWLAERIHQRCRYCDTADYWKWICYECHEKTVAERIRSLQLQLDVAVLNAGNPELMEKLAVMDDDEVIGIVVPDILEAVDNLGIIIPAYYREKLDA
jgi:hypothetical protein